MRTRRRPRAWGVALAAACALLLPRPASAQDEGLFELRLTAVPQTRTVGVLVDASGQPLLPLRQVLDFLEIPVGPAPDGALSLEWPPGAWSTRIDTAQRTVRAGDSAFTAPEAEWLARDGEIFVSPAVLARVLGGAVQVDWENLGVLLAGRADYPLVRRLHNQARRQGGARSRLPEDADLPVDYPARSGGGTLGWGVSAALVGDQVQASGRAGLGLAVAGGALETGATLRGTGETTRVGDLYARYARSFPRGTWVRQVQVGDVQADGLVARPFFGVSVSNEPLYAPRHFGEALVRPVVPAGWEYEVYQGDHLVGVSSAGAGDPVPTPIGYGTTPVRVRMLGPAGQERTEEIVFLVPAVQVPAGAWRYAAGGGACRLASCDALAYADVRRGVSNALTVGLGIDHTARDSGSATRPYGTLSFNPRPELRTELRVRPGALVYASVHRYQRLGGWRLAGGWRGEEGYSPLAVPVWFGEANGSVRTPLPGRGQVLALFARARIPAEGEAEGRDQWQAGFTSGVASVGFGASYERGYQVRDVLSLHASTVVPRWILPVVRSWSVNGRLDVADGAVHGLSLATTFRPLDRASVSAGLTWYAEGGPVGVSLSLVTRTPGAYLQSHAYSEGGREGAFASAGGGVAVGRGGGWVASPFETVGRGGVTGRVFHDVDGDGAWTPGEPTAAGVPVIVGGERAVSDAEGVYRAWGLLPYRVVSLAVDTLNLPVTNLSSRRAEYLLRPTPNLYARQDLPLVRTREATGRVRWEGAPAVLGGIGVEARAVEGDAVHRVATFSDGEFYFPRLPAGEYTLAVAESSLRALGATAEAVRFTVPGGEDSAPATAPSLVLRRAQP